MNKRSHRKDHRHSESARGDYHCTAKIGDASAYYVCPRCGKSIKDLSAALADKPDGQPVHFDCVLNFLKEHEILHENEALSYIGQGRFAVLRYTSMVTMKDFVIVRIIEWEDKNSRAEWRSTLANRFSLID